MGNGACGEDFRPGQVTNYLLERLKLFVATWPDLLKLNIEMKPSFATQIRYQQCLKDNAVMRKLDRIPARPFLFLSLACQSRSQCLNMQSTL